MSYNFRRSCTRKEPEFHPLQLCVTHLSDFKVDIRLVRGSHENPRYHDCLDCQRKLMEYVQ